MNIMTKTIIKPEDEPQKKLFETLAWACLDQPISVIQGAAVNLLLTVVQRNFIKLADAEARWDELMGRGKIALQRRYRHQDSDESIIGGRLGN